MATIIKKDTKFSPLLDLPRKSYHQAIHCPTANFGPLSRGNINHCVWYLFDQRLTGSQDLNQDPSDSDCSPLTHHSTSLGR